MHYYKRNLGDYAKKAGRLSMLQHGAYTLLLDTCYDREQFPTMEQALEWTWASTTEEVEAVKLVLSRFFTLNADGVYVQDRVLAELLDYQSKADKNKQIAVERETKRRQKSTNRARTVHEPPPEEHEPPPNHKPLTNSVDKSTGVPPADPIFGTGLQFLRGKGLDEKLARSFLGKLRKDAGDIATIRALSDAMASDISDPIPWLTKATKAPSAVPERKPWN